MRERNQIMIDILGQCRLILTVSHKVNGFSRKQFFFEFKIKKKKTRKTIDFTCFVIFPKLYNFNTTYTILLHAKFSFGNKIYDTSCTDQISIFFRKINFKMYNLFYKISKMLPLGTNFNTVQFISHHQYII